MVDGQTEKAYAPFVVNRCMSYFPDTLLHANEMNRLNFLDKKVQYDYYLRSIRSRKRFSKWFKKEDSEDIDRVKQYYGYSDKRAREAIRILTPEQLKNIKKELDIGGSRK
jgi:hypothetical protein